MKRRNSRTKSQGSATDFQGSGWSSNCSTRAKDGKDGPVTEFGTSG
jgi:hypothetical protein